ncbi:hypothetical protein [Microcoleus sp. S13_B4]
MFLAGSARLFVQQGMVKLLQRSNAPAVRIDGKQAKVKEKQGH